MQINLSVNVASTSADPVVNYLQWLKKQAYADSPNAVQAKLADLDADVAEEAYLIVLGSPSLTSKDPIGFAVQDPFDDSFPVVYLDPKYAKHGRNAKVTRVRGMTYTLADAAIPAAQQLTRINFDNL